MGLFDLFKKKPEPAAAAPVEEPEKPALVLDEAELMGGYPRLTRFDIADMDDEYYAIMDDYADDKEGAFKAYMALAQRGNWRAMYDVSLAYSLGDGVEQDYAESYRWQCRSAAAGYAGAQVEMGSDYSIGFMEYLEKDLVKSFYWYLKASRQEIYYDESDDSDITDEDYDDETTYFGEEFDEIEPYSPNKSYVEEAQAKVKEIIASIQNGTFEGTQAQAQQILNMYR